MSDKLDALGAEIFWFDRPSVLVDKVSLRGCRLPAKGAGPVRPLLFLHGYTEFLEKYALEVFGRLQAMGFTVWSFDWRGQGLSTRLIEDRMRGHVSSLDDHLEDAKAFAAMMVERDGGDAVLAGHSMGGHLALRMLAELPEPFRHAVILSPMIGISTAGLPKPVAVGLLNLFNNFGLSTRYPPGVPPTDPLDREFPNNVLTTDKTRFDAVRQAMRDNPDLRIGAPTIGWAAAAFASIAKLSKPDYLARIETPLTIFLSGNDRVVDNEAAEDIARHLPHAGYVEIEGAEHELLMETNDRQAAVWAYFEGLVE